MARAKSTERAEARRRYRAYLQAQAEAEGTPPEEEVAPRPQPAARADRPTPDQVVRPGQKVGIFSAFKLATRPVHYIDDLRYAPTLIMKTNAIWPTALLSFASLAFGLTQNDWNSGGFSTVRDLLIATPPLIQPMLAGFLAPRATWLAGIISSLISSFCLDVLIFWALGGHVANVPEGTLAVIPFSLDLALTAITFGALLGAASGWYKRFLSLASPAPARTQRPAAKKPAQRRPAARR